MVPKVKKGAKGTAVVRVHLWGLLAQRVQLPVGRRRSPFQLGAALGTAASFPRRRGRRSRRDGRKQRRRRMAIAHKSADVGLALARRFYAEHIAFNCGPFVNFRREKCPARTRTSKPQGQQSAGLQ